MSRQRASRVLGFLLCLYLAVCVLSFCVTPDVDIYRPPRFGVYGVLGRTYASSTIYAGRFDFIARGEIKGLGRWHYAVLVYHAARQRQVLRLCVGPDCESWP